MSRLIGGPDLRARLASLAEVGPEFEREWADETVKRIRQTKPPSREAASDRFTTRVTRTRAGVYGAFWWIFVDRGTKAHDIIARKAQALMFHVGGQTIFAKKTHHPRTARRPFITKAAQGALAGSRWNDTVVKLWNRRRTGSHQAFL